MQKNKKTTPIVNCLAGITLAAAFALSVGYWSGDDAQEPQLTPAEMIERDYKAAILSGDAGRIAEWGAVLGGGELSEWEVQYIKDTALFEAARHGDAKAIAASLSSGADMLSYTIGGDNFVTLALRNNGLSFFSALQGLEKTFPQISYGNIVNDDALIWSLLMDYDHEEDCAALLPFLREISRYKIDLAAIGLASGAGRPFDFIALAHEYDLSELLIFLQEKRFYTNMPEAVWDYDLYADYMSDKAVPIVQLDQEAFERSDYYMYQGLDIAGAPNDNGVEPTLFLLENTDRGTDELRLGHITKVGYTANGVSRVLAGRNIWGGDREPLQMIVARIQGAPILNDNNILRSSFPLLKYAKGDYTIVSESVRVAPVGTYRYEQMYADSIVTPKNVDFTLLDTVMDNVFYTPAGNDFPDDCIMVDGHDFCLQDKDPVRHAMDLVRVGAAYIGAVEGEESHNYVASYSGQNPTFCAYLPFYEGAPLRGTSFSTPAAAAVEQRLADDFARSAAYPNGASHDDIVFALMATASHHDLRDPRDGSMIETFKNIAGLEMSARCGAGVIQPQAAADLLAQMAKWVARDVSVTPSVARLDKNIMQMANVREVDGRYHYKLRFDQSGILLNFRTGVFFHGGDKGAAQIKIGDAPPVTLDLSAVGIASEFRFVGHRFAEGEEVTIITTQPMGADVLKASRPFLDYKYVAPSSPIGLALDKVRAQGIM